MPQPLVPDIPAFTAPRFYVTPRQPFRPGPILLAIAIAAGALFAVLHALEHGRHGHGGSRWGRSSHTGRGGSASAAAPDEDDDDDTSLETIYLGDPSEAPVPVRPGEARNGGKPSAVHPFVVVRLPREGADIGQIPDTPAGRLLYAWLAAFNKTDEEALSKALPSAASEISTEAQIELRKQTGGFNLLSAREVQPGLLVFRMTDQTPASTEVLGTLQVRPNAKLPSIASFSLRAIPKPPPAASGNAGPASAEPTK